MTRIVSISKNDDDIIEGIRNFDNEAGNTLYLRHKEYCIGFMNSMYFDEETNKDIYQDALIVFIEKVRGNRLKLENTSIQTYLNSICRNQVLIRLKNKKKPVLMGDNQDNDFDPKITDWYDEQEENKSERIKVIMEELDLMKTSGKCYELLRKVFFENVTMEKLATLMKYTNADNAKNQSYRCRERLKKRVFERLKL